MTRREPWADRARAELRPLGDGRKARPQHDPTLTPQELQIAHFVAEGLANKEIAAQVFLTKRTIYHHLRIGQARDRLAHELAGFKRGDESCNLQAERDRRCPLVYAGTAPKRPW